MEYTVCDLCGKKDFEEMMVVYDRLGALHEQFRVVRCRACGLVCVNPRPSAQEIGRYYPDAYVSYHPLTGFRWIIKAILLRAEVRRLKKLLPPGARIFDVGAGSGEDAAFLRDHGAWRVEACDTSRFAALQARRLFNLDLRVGALESLGLSPERYDVVRMRYVLSHVHSPRRTLAEAHRILKSGGLLMLWVPNVDSLDAKLFGRYWEGQEPPRHLFDFSPRTVTAYLSAAGFSVERVRHSAVPNTFIHSARNFLASRGAPRIVIRACALNPFTLALFFPIALAAALMKKSDRISVIARKKS